MRARRTQWLALRFWSTTAGCHSNERAQLKNCLTQRFSNRGSRSPGPGLMQNRLHVPYSWGLRHVHALRLEGWHTVSVGHGSEAQTWQDVPPHSRSRRSASIACAGSVSSAAVRVLLVPAQSAQLKCEYCLCRLSQLSCCTDAVPVLLVPAQSAYSPCALHKTGSYRKQTDPWRIHSKLGGKKFAGNYFPER
jgi:hypothetical protein